MQYFRVILIIAFCLSYARTLVHFKQTDKGADGCKIDGTELKVGEYLQDDNVCGIIRCEDKNGSALIMYCQIPIPSARCKQKYVNTEQSFPECCWTCVGTKDC